MLKNLKNSIDEGTKRYGSRMNDRDMGDYAKCASCSHEKALHGNGACFSCGCADFKNTLANQDNASAGYRKGLYDNETVWTCNTCDSYSPDEAQIKMHVKHEHGIQNAAGGKCACGNEINPRSQQFYVEPMCDQCLKEEKQLQKGERSYERENDKDITSAEEALAIGMPIPSAPKKNEGPALGYQYGMLTTTKRPRHNETENTICEICTKETGAALEDHLTTRHGMDVEDAGVVARDIERRQNRT